SSPSHNGSNKRTSAHHESSIPMIRNVPSGSKTSANTTSKTPSCTPESAVEPPIHAPSISSQTSNAHPSKRPRPHLPRKNRSTTICSSGNSNTTSNGDCKKA